MIFNDPDVRMRPKPKRVRDYDHDMESIEVKASELIAGDMVVGLGILDAILFVGMIGNVLLCAGEEAWEVPLGAVLTIHPAMCKVCAMHPDDCHYYGCDKDPIWD